MLIAEWLYRGKSRTLRDAESHAAHTAVRDLQKPNLRRPPRCACPTRWLPVLLASPPSRSPVGRLAGDELARRIPGSRARARPGLPVRGVRRRRGARAADLPVLPRRAGVHGTRDARSGPGWDTPAARAAARIVYLLAGVSYYKTAAPPVIDLGDAALTGRERAFLREFYLSGLGEYAYRNGLDLSGLRIEAPVAMDDPAPATARAAEPASADPLRRRHRLDRRRRGRSRESFGKATARLWGTSLVADINPGSASSYPSHPVDVNGTAFFAANDGVRGFELWRTDGSAAGTSLVKDIDPGSTKAQALRT